MRVGIGGKGRRKAGLNNEFKLINSSYNEGHI
jgi:hypothetical protein